MDKPKIVIGITKPQPKPTSSPAIAKPIAKSSIPVAKGTNAVAKPTVSAASIKAQLDKTDKAEVGVSAGSSLLDAEEAFMSPLTTVREKLAAIESFMEEQEIPIVKLRSGLKDVMTCIKNAGDDIMELQPSDIKTIVQGYIRTADAETQRIVQGKSKAPTKEKKEKKAKASSALALAKQIDIEEVEL